MLKARAPLITFFSDGEILAQNVRTCFRERVQININFSVPSIKHCQKKQVEVSYAKTNEHFQPLFLKQQFLHLL
jgi:hypothetical protein